MHVYYIVLSVRHYHMHINVYAINEHMAKDIAIAYIAHEYNEDAGDIRIVKCILKRTT